MIEIVILILALLGLVMFFRGFHLQKRTAKFISTGTKTVANIISYVEEERESKNSTYSVFYPLISFVPIDEKEKVFKQLKNTITPQEKAELPVPLEIYYIKEYEEYEIIIGSKYQLFTFPLMLKVAGVFLVVLGVFLWGYSNLKS